MSEEETDAQTPNGMASIAQKAMQLLPLLSIGTVAIVAIFNVGYFFIIGLHFIGIMDISNIVYTLALVFSLLLLVMVGLPYVEIESIKEFAKKPGSLEKVSRILLRYVMPVLGIVYFFLLILTGNILKGYLTTTGWFALGWGMGVIISSAMTYMHWCASGTIKSSQIVSIICLFVLSLAFFGSATAEREAFESKNLYTVTTKDAVLEDVRLVRSSSSGFIVSKGGKIMFIPSGEIKLIAAKRDPYGS